MIRGSRLSRVAEGSEHDANRDATRRVPMDSLRTRMWNIAPSISWSKSTFSPRRKAVDCASGMISLAKPSNTVPRSSWALSAMRWPPATSTTGGSPGSRRSSVAPLLTIC